MSSYGSVKWFQPSWTELGPDGQRQSFTSPRFAYKFYYRGVRYTKGGFLSKKEAVTEGEKKRGELRAGLDTDPDHYTMAALHELGSAHASVLDETTQASHAIVWKRLLAFFKPTMRVAAVDDVALLRYLKHQRQKGASDNSTRLDFAWLRRAMNLANKKRLLPYVPEFPPVKIVKRERVFAPGQLDLVLQHLPPFYQLLFWAAQITAWRVRSELCTRRWTDVTDDGLVLDAESAKGGKARSFPITQTLREVLALARAHVDNVQRITGKIVPWVFCRDDGSPIRDYSGAWDTALRKAGVLGDEKRKPWQSGVVVHDIRRTTLRDWKKRYGLSLEQRLALGGHSERAHAMYMPEGPDVDEIRAAGAKLDQGARTDEKLVTFRAKEG